MMAEESTGYDWSEITGRTTERLRAAKVRPCDPAVVKAAQLSYDEGTARDHQFRSEKEAAAFAAEMKKAGPHTVPQTSVSVVIDPDNTDNTRLVAWKAGARRGKKAA
jgi:hypothetical protein